MVVRSDECATYLGVGANGIWRLLEALESGENTPEEFDYYKKRSLYRSVFSLYSNDRPVAPNTGVSEIFSGLGSAAERETRRLETAGYSLHLLGIEEPADIQSDIRDDPEILDYLFAPRSVDGEIRPEFFEFVESSISKYREAKMARRHP